MADNPEQKIFSQQANILAVLYDVIPKDHQQQVLRKMLAIEPGTTPDGVLSASYYFRFYLARALDHAGMADEYLDSIGPWRKLLPLHFSTWPEIPATRAPTRTPGPPIRSTTCSRWSPASSRPAPASPRCASRRTSAPALALRPPFRIRRASIDVELLAARDRGSTQPSRCPAA